VFAGLFYILEVYNRNFQNLRKRSLEMKEYKFDSKIYASEVGKGGAYVIFPYDVREEFGKGRVKVRATFDGVDYDGSIVNMGVKNEDGSICYILGIRKDIRKEIGKDIGDAVEIVVQAL
jgi:bifunctional DNA-binding transcriptional regulator/antitoxin component of YhaV-PrlF toxin-antitoxin module